MSGRITALKAQERNPQRISVFLDGKFSFGLARITAAWLKVGQVLSEEELAKLQAQDEREVAYQRALRFLDYRPRTSKEVRLKLENGDFSEAVIGDVLERLQRSGLVNDAQYARDWVENRRDFRPRSRKALAFEMQRRGLSQETIEQALQEMNPDEDALAYQAGLKQARKLSNLEWNDYRRKLSGFLARRGFAYDVITPVVERLWNEKQSKENK